MRLFRIGEVARQLGEQPHTLRHWERHFGCPHPRRGSFGERLYSEDDIALLRRIQHLLRVERLTLEQAKRLFVPRTSPERVRQVQRVLRALQLLVEPTTEGS
ncbi:HTH-type transcriptional repressor BluR [bacterium HR21]|nr:HTH-type transcriptional repressor BluR [bacterium HR21]